MPHDTRDEAMSTSAPVRASWPERPQEDWHSLREKVRTSGADWEVDENPAATALRYRMAAVEPAAPATGRLGRALHAIDRAITAWEQLPERVQTRVYIGVGAGSAALFLVLLFTI